MRAAWVAVAAAGIAAGLVIEQTAAEQSRPRRSYDSGQEVVPAYEGWEQNDDGSFNLVFGTMNRNWEESLHIPLGPENNIEPGGRTTVNPPGSCRGATGSCSASACPRTSATRKWSGR